MLIFKDEFHDLISLLYLQNPVWKAGQKWLQGQRCSFLNFFQFNFYFMLKYNWFFFIFFLIMVFHRILTIAPMLYSRTLLFIHSACDRLHLVTASSWFHALQGRSPGRGHGNPLWYSCLENPMDKEESNGLPDSTGQAILVHRVAESRTRLEQLCMHNWLCMQINTIFVLVSDVQLTDSVIHIHISVPFQILFPYWLLPNIEYSSLSYTVGPSWLYIL